MEFRKLLAADEKAVKSNIPNRLLLDMIKSGISKVRDINHQSTISWGGRSISDTNIPPSKCNMKPRPKGLSETSKF